MTLIKMHTLITILLLVVITQSATSASYRGTTQLENKINKIQEDVSIIGSYIKTLRLEDISRNIENVGVSMQDIPHRLEELQKRTEVWSTHEHFITSWLDQISSVDRKLDIIIKSQERLNKVESQLHELQEQINKIDVDRFESLVTKVAKRDTVNNPTKTSSNSDLISLIDEYTTRGVLSTLNRIENQLITEFKQKRTQQCEANATIEILEDIAAKIDVIVDKISIPEPSIDHTEQSAVKPVTIPTVTEESVEQATKLCSNEEVIMLERKPSSGNEYLNYSWTEYQNGFNTNTSNWIGLETIVKLGQSCKNLKLRIEIWDFDGNFAWAKYNQFGISDEASNYTLTVDGYSGNATDSLGYHNGVPFSTYDRNNDQAPECCPCAVTYGSGWWFNECFESNLNGKFTTNPYVEYYDGIIWEGWLGNYSLKRAKMIIF